MAKNITVQLSDTVYSTLELIARFSKLSINDIANNIIQSSLSNQPQEIKPATRKKNVRSFARRKADIQMIVDLVNKSSGISVSRITSRLKSNRSNTYHDCIHAIDNGLVIGKKKGRDLLLYKKNVTTKEA